MRFMLRDDTDMSMSIGFGVVLHGETTYDVRTIITLLLFVTIIILLLCV